MLTCIRNQGQRGTCHIFAAISAIEEIIARDTGVYVNLSEQDFMENEKLVWSPEYYNDAGSSGARSAKTLKTTATNSPSKKPGTITLRSPSQGRPPTNTSAVARAILRPVSPAAPPPLRRPTDSVFPEFAFFILRPVYLSQNPNPSPYSSAGVSYIWNPSNPDLSVDYIFLSLAFNSAVVLGFNETQAFQNAANGNGFISYTAGQSHFPDLDGSPSAATTSTSSATSATKTSPPTPTPPPQLPLPAAATSSSKTAGAPTLGDAGYLYMPVDYLKANAFELAVISSVNKN